MHRSYDLSDKMSLAIKRVKPTFRAILGHRHRRLNGRGRLKVADRSVCLLPSQASRLLLSRSDQIVT